MEANLVNTRPVGIWGEDGICCKGRSKPGQQRWLETAFFTNLALNGCKRGLAELDATT